MNRSQIVTGPLVLMEKAMDEAKKAKLKRDTEEEWRELGFYYDYDKGAKSWRLVGSCSGLLKFCDLLEVYSQDSRNKGISEHDHYGPYMYLKIMTWNGPDINENAIAGTLADLKRLADICRKKLSTSKPGDVIRVDSEYVKEYTSSLQFEVQNNEFDPAGPDPFTWLEKK